MKYAHLLPWNLRSLTLYSSFISKVSKHNGIYLLYITVKIYHSGWNSFLLEFYALHCSVSTVFLLEPLTSISSLNYMPCIILCFHAVSPVFLLEPLISISSLNYMSCIILCFHAVSPCLSVGTLDIYFLLCSMFPLPFCLTGPCFEITVLAGRVLNNNN